MKLGSPTTGLNHYWMGGVRLSVSGVRFGGDGGGGDGPGEGAEAVGVSGL
jgi:hypothetical protein